MAKVSINIVTWNGIRFLPDALETIFAQTYKDFEIIIVDNGSTDGTVDYIRKNFPQITLLKNFKNLGFSRGYNQAIRLALERWPQGERDDKFILITNQDILLAPDFLEKIVGFTRGRNRVATFGGKLLRAYFDRSDDEFEQAIKSKIIDTAGLVIKKSRRVIDRGAGEEDRGQYNQPDEIFGVSGAIMLVRASALEDMRYGDEFFDEDFFTYKEDIDLAWRLRLMGWGSMYVPEAEAYHFRGAYSPAKSSIIQTLRQRRKRPRLVKLNSFTNHYLMLAKNSFFRNIIRDLPWIFFYEFKKNLYCLFFEPKIFMRGWLNYFSKRKFIKRKRRHVFNRLAIKAKDFRRWIK